MKTGRTLSQLAAELERRQETKRDYLAPQGKLEAIPVKDAEIVDDRVQLGGFNGAQLAITPYAHGQLASHLQIPKAYYDRMLAEKPELAAKNINEWLQADPENRRMLRTLDGKVRGVLSPKYRPLDNFDLGQVLLPKLMDLGAEITSCELTETRMYVKAVLPHLSDALPAGLAYGTGHNHIGGDRGNVVASIVASNSEVGAGTFRIEPSVFTSWCTNLAIMEEASMKKYHVGRAHEADASWEVFRDETRVAEDRAFWLKVGDVTAAAFDRKVFERTVTMMRRAAGEPIKSDDLAAVVDMTVETLNLPKSVNSGVLSFLAKGGDLTKWGLSSAITRVANDTEDYEAATALERAGGAILSLPANSWAKISEVKSAA